MLIPRLAKFQMTIFGSIYLTIDTNEDISYRISKFSIIATSKLFCRKKPILQRPDYGRFVLQHTGHHPLF